MQKVKIGEISVAKLTFDQALEEISKLLEGDRAQQVCTLNAEFVLAASSDVAFDHSLKEARLVVADGIGILWAAKYLSLKHKNWMTWFLSQAAIVLDPKFVRSVLPETVSGSDLFWPLMDLCHIKKKKVFLLGAALGVAQELSKIVNQKYPNLELVGAYAGSPKEEDQQNIVEIINNSATDLLLVAYNFQAQEKWINRNLDKFKTVKVAIGLGGTFDFVTGASAIGQKARTKRAPSMFRKLGLEWLWRLITQPYRWRRVYNAVVKFPILIYKNRNT